MPTRPACPPFDPNRDTKAYRTALGRFATGVTVITAQSHGLPIGITANSFSSISLDPPLVLWSPAKNSSRHDPFVQAEHFAIHILAADQKAVSEAFAKSRNGFDAVDAELNKHGVPIISGCLAVFECVQKAQYDAGDHTIILGQVDQARERPGRGLVFFNGQFSNDEGGSD